MMRKFLGLMLLVLAIPAGAASLPAVTVVLSQETGAVGADGITRISHYRERMFRDSTHVWTQRLLPRNAPHGHAHEDGHEHPDFTLAARLVTLGKDGKADLVMVMPEKRLIVTLSPVDYEEQGFSRCWSCAVHLIDLASLKRMPVSGREGVLTTHTRRDNVSEVVVVWDESLQLVREIRERRLDGSRWSTLRVSSPSGPVSKPWASASGYMQRTIGDYGD